MRSMAAARFRAAISTRGAQRTSRITEESSRFPLILKTNRSNSTSASSESNLLQKLIDASDSRIKATLDFEFPSDSNQFPWPSLFVSLHDSAPQKANLVLEWKLGKLREGDIKSEQSYIDLLYLCERIVNLPLALRVFTSVEALGTKPTTSLFNSLITTSLLSGNLLTALSLFEIMCRSDDYRPDSTTFDAFISQYAKSNDFDAVKSWISARRDCGFPDDAQMYESLIQCCVKSNKFIEAGAYYDEMVSAGLVLTDSILTNMVKAFCRKKNFTKLKEILKASIDSGIVLDENSMTRIMRLYQQQGQVECIEEIMEMLMGTTQNTSMLSLLHSFLVSSYSDGDRVEDIELSVKRMLDQGISFSSAEIVENVIDCYFRNEAYDKLELFLGSIRGMFELRKSTYDLLCAGYQNAGLTEKLEAVANDMKIAGFLLVPIAVESRY